MRFLARCAAMLVFSVVLAPCAGAEANEKADVADHPHATAGNIIDAGHAVAVAMSGDQLLVTWEVEPQDAKGPSRGAWRLYDEGQGRVADGTIGALNEASGRVGVVGARGGFLLIGSANSETHFLDRRGHVSSVHLHRVKPGASLAGGSFSSDGASEQNGPPVWRVFLPDRLAYVDLTPIHADGQDVEMTSDGTVWVLLPGKSGAGPFRVAHAKNGVGPWKVETIPVPQGAAVSGDSMSVSGDRLFIVATRRAANDRLEPAAILSLRAGDHWEKIGVEGMGEHLIDPPQIAALPKGRLVATSGEGDWIQSKDRSRFIALHPPGKRKDLHPLVWRGGRWLWSTGRGGDNRLFYSYTWGDTWHEFDR